MSVIIIDFVKLSFSSSPSASVQHSKLTTRTNSSACILPVCLSPASHCQHLDTSSLSAGYISQEIRAYKDWKIQSADVSSRQDVHRMYISASQADGGCGSQSRNSDKTEYNSIIRASLIFILCSEEKSPRVLSSTNTGYLVVSVLTPTGQGLTWR